MEAKELVFVPLAEIGHLTSTVELAKGLHERQRSFSITILLMHLYAPFVQSFAASHPEINFVHLPIVDFPLKDDVNPITYVSLFVENHKSHVKEAINKRKSSPSNVAALILDLSTTMMLDVGAELGIPTYICFTSGAASLALMPYLLTLHVKIPCEFKDFHGEVEVPGMPPLPTVALLDLMMNKKEDDYTWYLTRCPEARRRRRIDCQYVRRVGADGG